MTRCCQPGCPWPAERPIRLCEPCWRAVVWSLEHPPSPAGHVLSCERQLGGEPGIPPVRLGVA